MLVESLIATALAVVIWKLSKPKPKVPPKKELCVDEVLKAADDALAFDPLAEAKNKPEAVKPLLAVLLAIREKKAAEDLALEEIERERKVHYGPKGARSFGSLLGAASAGYRMTTEEAERHLQQSVKNKREQFQSDGLSATIGPEHPHYPFTAAGRAAAAAQEQARMAQEQARIQAQMEQKPIGYYALGGSALSGYIDSPPYQGPHGT